MLYVLDPDIASYIIKSKSAAAERKLSSVPPAQLAISAITRVELLYGLKRLPANHRLHVVVQQFLRIIPVMAWEP